MGKNVRAKMNTKHVDDTCRLCLRKSANVRIWDNAYKYWYHIKAFCRVRLRKRDGLPAHICGDCSATLVAMEYLRVKAQESDRLLRNKLVLSDQNVNNYFDVKNEFDIRDIKVEKEPNIEDESNSFDPIANVECHFENAGDRDQFSFPHSTLGVSNSDEILNIGQPTQNVVECKREAEDCSKEKQLCPVCGKVLYNSSLNKHMESHRLKDENACKAFACTKCICSFYSEKRLEKHMKYHALEKIYPCKVCGKKFKEQHIVNRHVKIVHEKYQATECPVCHKVLGSKLSYTKHLETHTGKKRFECDICNKKFTSRGAMVAHFRIHTGEKPFKCDICKSCYRTPKTLIEHVRLHTGEKPYRCPVCSKGFAQKSNMKSHFRYNHKDEVYK